MILKDMLNEVLAQSSHLKKGSFANTTDVDDVQMVSLANRVQQEIRDWFDWAELRRPYTITIIDGQNRYNLPADFHSLVPNSAWEVNGNEPVEIPVPNRRWFVYKSTSWSDGGTLRCRFYGDQIEVHDAAVGEDFTLEYISKWAVKDDDGSVKEYFTDDTDSFLLDDRVFILGVQAAWAETKLLPQAASWNSKYMSKLNELIGRTTGGRTIGGRPTRSSIPAPYTPLYVK